jgi:hypothetical protein
MSDDPLRGIDFSERVKPLMREMVLLDQKRMEQIATLRKQLRAAVPREKVREALDTVPLLHDISDGALGYLHTALLDGGP